MTDSLFEDEGSLAEDAACEAKRGGAIRPTRTAMAMAAARTVPNTPASGGVAPLCTGVGMTGPLLGLYLTRRSRSDALWGKRREIPVPPAPATPCGVESSGPVDAAAHITAETAMA